MPRSLHRRNQLRQMFSGLPNQPASVTICLPRELLNPMIAVKRNRVGLASLAKILARVSVALCLALSFFLSLLPLAASASASDSTMACCVGAAHCTSGLIVESPKPPAGAGIASLATASAMGVAESSNHQHSAESTTTAHHTPALGHSLAKPCPVDCCASTAAGTRKPRPREASLLTNAGYSFAPLTGPLRVTQTATFATSTSLQPILPRGPPTKLSEPPA